MRYKINKGIMLEIKSIKTENKALALENRKLNAKSKWPFAILGECAHSFFFKLLIFSLMFHTSIIPQQNLLTPPT
jgi:hypothetical protein